MTGPAKFAWIIATAWLFSSYAGSVRAAAPRDAIKHLSFQYQSTLGIRENDSDQNPEYSENFTSTFSMSWRPPAVRLPSGPSITTSVFFNKSLNDSAQRLISQQIDSVNDHFKVDLKLAKLNYLSASYLFERNDSARSGRSFNSSTTKVTNIGFTPPGFLSLAYFNKVNSVNGSTSSSITSASESEQTHFAADYKQDIGDYGQQYFYQYQINISRNKLQSGSDRDTSNSLFSGSRQIGLKQAGTLQIGYNYREINEQSLLGEQNKKTDDNKLDVILSNSLNALPLNYNFKISNQYRSNPNDNSSYRELKSVSFTYKSPAPPGKSLSVVYRRELIDSDSATARIPTSETTDDNTTIQWNFQANPRTNGSFSFLQQLSTDRLLSEITRKSETVRGNLGYQIPGQRGNLSADFSQLTYASPRSDSKSVTNSINLNNHLRLGQGAQVSFFLSQHYSGEETGRNDTTSTGVSYELFKRAGLSLRTQWKQILQVRSERDKNNAQEFNVYLAYDTPARWRYEFMLLPTGTRDISNLRPNSQTYNSKNEIQFKVSYSF